ncbi:MAG: hypothetical protein IKD59_01835, partial [Lachnospiraceae bacterium]|nr:hypothetical protein [Lachnospiraceae bacterium]
LDAVPNTSTGVVQFTITEETACDVAATAIYFIPEGKPSNPRIVAILPHGTTTGQATVPEVVGATHTCFGAQAFVGYYSGTTISNLKMKSGTTYDSDIPAVAPANVAVVESPLEGSVRVSWTWSWSAASEAEIAWADNEYAWESTNEPSTYRVKDNFATSWIVAGLEADKTWFFRVRLIDTSGDTEVVGPWSEMVSYNLAGNPERPALFLSKSVISPGDTVVARWVYIASGNDEQEYAEICLVTYDEDTGDPIYGDVIATAGAEQSVEIAREWETDTTYYLALRTTSNTGRQSEWSEVASLFVAPPVSISLVSSSITVDSAMVYHRISFDTYITTETYINDEPNFISHSQDSSYRGFTGCDQDFIDFMRGNFSEVSVSQSGNQMTVVTRDTTVSLGDPTGDGVPELDSLPLTANITGAGASGTTILSIVRAENYYIDHPDEKNNDGYAGELIASRSIVGEGSISIRLSDVVGNLYDGGKYYLVGKIIDAYGRSASFQYPFWVDWSLKPHVPTVTIEMDPYQRIAKITPFYDGVGRVDIYRISADKPELIYKDAQYGITYVDPYPALGEAGGHRLVCKSPYSRSYVTYDGTLAWYDAGIDDRDILRDESMVIDVDGEQIVLPYNLELSNKWNKDFKRTSYLGGSVQGDWNPAVTRDLTANTVLVRGDDLDRQLSMRDLAGYAGIAHVRTPDGSSLTVNVQIDERQSYDSRKISYTLTMQAIDPEALDGMTLTEWEEMHPIVET